MATKDIEGALRCLVMDATADRCGALADALGVGHECGASEEACEACASRMAEAIISRMMPEGIEWPRFADGEPVRLGDEVLGKHGEPMAVTRVSFVEGGCYFNESHHKNGRKRGKGWRYVAGERVKRPEQPDTQERIEADARKTACEYFGWEGVPCSEKGGCPARERFLHCGDAKTFDLLRRQRELCAKEAAR